MSAPKRILSLGAGRQSTALFILGCEGKVLPKLDAAVFADTQWEPRHVMNHLEMLRQYGAEHGVPVYLATKGNLPKDVLDRRVFATIPAWTRTKPFKYVPVAWKNCPSCGSVTGKDGTIAYTTTSPGALFGDDECEDCDGSGLVPSRWDHRPQEVKDGRVKRQCTPKYKIEVIDAQVRVLLGAREWDEPCRYCDATGQRIAPWDPEAQIGPCSICRGSGTRHRVGSVPKGAVSEQWVGFSTDEFERVSTAGFPPYERPRHPLIELGWTVEDCMQLNTDKGWQSEKSACVGCPFHEDPIWLDMKARDPEDFASAVAFDHAFRTAPGLNVERFLHESRQPLDVAVAHAERVQKAAGTQLLVLGAPRRKQPRGCSPYGCRTQIEIEEGLAS